MIILAGGRARRLGGRDKPGMTVGPDTLIGSVVNAGTAAGARPVVVVGPARPGLSPEMGRVRFVSEQPPGAGPVPALRRGLAELSGPWVAVLAADLPFLRAAHLSTLLSAASGGAGAVLADDTGRPQWLAGCWRIGALRDAMAGYHGDSLRGLLAPLGPTLVHPALAPGQPPPWLDCDTPEDLDRVRELAGRFPREPDRAAAPPGQCYPPDLPQEVIPQTRPRSDEGPPPQAARQARRRL